MKTRLFYSCLLLFSLVILFSMIYKKFNSTQEDNLSDATILEITFGGWWNDRLKLNNTKTRWTDVQKSNNRLPQQQQLKWWDRSEGARYAKYGDGSCRQNPIVKKTLQKLLQEWKDITRRSTISYFLTDASLLGAWRNEDSLPADIDVDVVVDLRELEKLDAIAKVREMQQKDTNDKVQLIVQIDWKLPQEQRRRMDCKGKFVETLVDQCAFREPVARLIDKKIDLHLDVFGSRLYGNTVEFLEDRNLKLSKSNVYPLQFCKFMNMTTFCPQNPKLILQQLYNGILKPMRICKQGKWVEAE